MLILTRENSRVVSEAGSELRSRRVHVLCTFCLSQQATPLRVGSGREWSGLNMNAWAGNLVPAPLRVSSHWRRKRVGVGGGDGGQGACAPPPLFDWGAMVCLCPPPPPLLTPHFNFLLELYVYITLTNNYLAFFIYQLIILWTISIY